MPAHEVKWGIISTGGIATSFSKDLLVDPSTRKVTDVSHKIVAIGSRAVPSAQAFIDKLAGAGPQDSWSWGVKNGKLEGCKAYGSYEEVYNDPNVDAIYIGTPHNYHYANTKGALLGGKNVLCEKPFTMDLEELDELIKLAKEKNLFLMEAVWTRFQPLAYKVKEVIESGKLGKPKRFIADFSSAFDCDSKPVGHRLLAPELAGGALLDMGPYPSVWAMLCLHHHPLNKDRKAPKMLQTHQTVYARTGVDMNSRWLLEWENLCEAQLITDMDCAGFKEATAIMQCENGDLAIEGPPYKPETFHVIPHLNPKPSSTITEKQTYHVPIHTGNNGMSYEADEVARCLRDGKKDSDRMPLEESRIVQGWFDQVRREGDSVLKDFKGGASK